MGDLQASSSQSTENSVDESLDLFYLHHGDNLGTILIQTPLMTENYHTWSRSMERDLAAKNKLEMVDSSMPQPHVNSPDLKAWKKCNNMVLSWITNSVSKDIAISIIYITKADDAWKDLKTRFSKGNDPRTFQLQKNIDSLAQKSNSVSTYYTQFKGILEKFSNYRPIPNCSCGKCTCGSMQSVSEFHSQMCIYHFLMGFNDQFLNVCGQILLMEPLPLFNKVFSVILQDERQKSHLLRGIFSLIVPPSCQELLPLFQDLRLLLVLLIEVVLELIQMAQR